MNNNNNNLNQSTPHLPPRPPVYHPQYLTSEDVLRLSRFEIFIPQTYNPNVEAVEFFTHIISNTIYPSNYPPNTSRDYIVQGELLKCFLIIKPAGNISPQTSPPVKTSGADDTSNPALAVLEQLTLDVRFKEPNEMVNSNKSSASVMKTKGEDVLATIPQHTHVDPNVPNFSPPSTPITLGNLTNFIKLPTGELVYGIEVPISLKDRFVDEQICLMVQAKPSNLGGIKPTLRLDKLLSPQSVERRTYGSRIVQTVVKVLQPLSIWYNPNIAIIGDQRLLSVTITNLHPTFPIIIHDLYLYLYSLYKNTTIPSSHDSDFHTHTTTPLLQNSRSTSLDSIQITTSTPSVNPPPPPPIPTNLPHPKIIPTPLSRLARLTDFYTCTTLGDAEAVTILPGDQHSFVMVIEPMSTVPTTPSSLVPSMSPPSSAKFSANQTAMHISQSMSNLSNFGLQAGINLNNSNSGSWSGSSSGSGSGAATKIKVEEYHTNLVFIWSSPSSYGRILSQFPVYIPIPQKNDMMVTFTLEPQISTNKIFSICFTITNLADYSRDLSFILPSPTETTPQIPVNKTHLQKTFSNSSIGSASSSQTALDQLDSPTTSSTPPNTLTSPLHTTQDNFQLNLEGEKKPIYGPVANLICIEKSLYIGLVKGRSAVSVNVNYIALKEGLYEIKNIQIFDRATDLIFTLTEPCKIYVV